LTKKDAEIAEKNTQIQSLKDAATQAEAIEDEEDNEEIEKLNTSKFNQSCYDMFNDDFKKRIEFQSKLLDWDNFGKEVVNNEKYALIDPPSIILDPNQEEYPDLHAQMEKVFFPLIDMKQYARIGTSEDLVVRNQLDEMVKMVFVELMTLHDVMRTYKDPKLFRSASARASKDSFDHAESEGSTRREQPQHDSEPSYLNGFQRWVIGRLMKRLLN
jgi:hypothetical protein